MRPSPKTILFESYNIVYIATIQIAEFNKKPYLYSLGDIPITRLKNFPKNVCDGKPNCWLICKIVRLVPFSKARASLTT